MPSAFSGQDDHYSRYHRRQSLVSQSSLPDQLQESSSPRPQSPDRSATILLPATTYGQTAFKHSQSPAVRATSTALPPSRNGSAGDIVSNSLLSDDPYRGYPAHHTDSGVTARQGSLRVDTIQQLLPSSTYSLPTTGRGPAEPGSAEQPTSTAVLPGLRGRKSSVKNLVAQINASSGEEPPPLPSSHISQPGSRNISPVIASAIQFPRNIVRQALAPNEFADVKLQPEHTRSLSPEQHGLELLNGGHIVDNTSYSRKPLFGEVVSKMPSISIPGFGIQYMRPRSGSEGSPLIGNSPGFSRTNEHVRQQSDHNTPTMNGPNTFEEGLSTLNTTPRPGPRRLTENVTTSSATELAAFRNQSHLPPDQPVVDGGRRKQSLSRIPVSAHRTSLVSSSGGPSSSTSAALSGARLRATTPKRSTPRRNDRSPPEIQSPGRRGKPELNNAAPKSPSLRANIIVPPTKVSPSLRSSRPRLPVSSASTAASRARMAEKFNEMQKINNEKRTPSRQLARPPELTDVDLKARRLRITQALSRSLEGQDLRGNFDKKTRRTLSSNGTISPSPSDHSQELDLNNARNHLPAVLVDHGAASESEREEFRTPEEGELNNGQISMGNAINAMPLSNVDNEDDDDSPTLGRGESPVLNKPTPLQTDFLRIDLDYEPFSAVTTATVDTEYTTIDPEPQTGVDELHSHRDTLLGHINRLRQQSSGSFQSGSPNGNLSDHDDQESVHLILRGTTYLDDSEAIRTGYRQPQTGVETVPNLSVPYSLDRNSWLSSANEEETQDEHHDFGTGLNSPARSQETYSEHRLSRYGGLPADKDDREAALRSTMASDAYTIVNIVLQQHSTGGVVDQQFVDDVYSRVLETPPYDVRGSISTNKIEQLCLRELQNRENNWRKSIISSRSPPRRADTDTGNKQPVTVNIHDAAHEPEPSPLEPPPPLFRAHHYKSSLDSVEDWANTSPSVGDWMRFAVDENGKQIRGQALPPGSSILKLHAQQTHDVLQNVMSAEVRPRGHDGTAEVEFESVLLEPPKMPPIPPAKDTPPVVQTTFGTALVEPPQVPQRLTSASQVAYSQPAAAAPHSQGAAQWNKTTAEETDGPEQRQFKKRRHIIKELVDTEFSYEKDLKVLCDIYKQTAAAALTDDDIKVLFGNVEQVQEYSRNFLMLLKAAAKPTYFMERPERKKESQSDVVGARRQSSSSTLASAKTVDNDTPSLEADRETSIGQAFEVSLASMEKIYADYIRNRNAANQRLEIVQKSATAREWLKECKDNSSDITNAWNLDALLVKPVQRITKYPLLLRELLESTPKDHPDAASVQRALHEVTEVNVRINDVKKHTELVDQVLNRKRKDSDVRIGLSKAFGRRAEKLKQHLGTAEMYEDNEYNEIKINYDNNIVQLMVVGNDCSSYGRAITRWVNKMVDVATAGEAWIDVGPSNHQEAESKLRHFAMVTRGISTIALPDHLEQLESKVLLPMQSAVDLMNKLKNDPKGLLQKRDKRLIDYAQARNKRDKGEKIDKKMMERMEQWEALNTEAKQRMKKLVLATAKLVQACQNNLIQMQMTWLKMVQTKLSTAMGFQLDRLERENIEKEWQLDFDFQEASALALGICNGSLLAEAVNMVSFQTPSTTVNGDDSPRQHSFTSTQKRSISMHSNGSHVQITEALPRTSGQYSRQPYESLNDRSQFYAPGFAGTRDRATSTATIGQIRSPEITSRNGHAAKHSSMGGPLVGSFVRSETRLSGSAPRLSVETPSPFLGSLQPDMNYRPPSTSTFFSANGEIPTSSRHQSTGSSIFSSAMPMSDSPVTERQSEPSARQPDVLFTAASVYEFNIDRSRQEAGFPYLTYVTGEIFDVIGERGELWLAKNQDDPQSQIGWIWNKHFAKLAE